MHLPLAPLAPLALALLPLAATAQTAAVLVVDASGGPGSQFTSLQAAVDAASDGDVLLIRAGTYGFTVVDGKSLRLQADDPGAVWVRLGVQNLGPSQPFTMRGLGSGSPMTLYDCLGPVLIEEGRFLALYATRCADLTLRGLTLEPSRVQACESGVHGVQSRLYVCDSRIEGHPGIEELGIGFCDGGDGITLYETSLYLHGSTVIGGNEETSGFPTSFVCAGHGIQAYTSGTVLPVEIMDSVVRAGGGGNCPPLPDIRGVTPTIRPGDARVVTASSPVREGQRLTIAYEGSRDDFVWLLHAATPWTARYFPIAGYLHTRLAETVLVPVGRIAGTTLQQSFRIPDYAGAGLVRGRFLQAFSVNPSGERAVSGPTHVTILDASF